MHCSICTRVQACILLTCPELLHSYSTSQGYKSYDQFLATVDEQGTVKELVQKSYRTRRDMQAALRTINKNWKLGENNKGAVLAHDINPPDSYGKDYLQKLATASGLCPDKDEAYARLRHILEVRLGPKIKKGLGVKYWVHRKDVITLLEDLDKEKSDKSEFQNDISSVPGY